MLCGLMRELWSILAERKTRRPVSASTSVNRIAAIFSLFCSVMECFNGMRIASNVK